MSKECRGAGRRWVLAVLSLLCVNGLSQAQDKTDPPRLLVSYDLKKAPAALKVIELRPNVDQSVYFFLENPGPDARRDLTVKLFKLLPNGATALLGETKVSSLGVDKREALLFGKPGPVPTDPKMPLPALEGPPYQFQMWIEEGKNEPVKVTFGVRLTEPREYVEVVAREYDPEKQRVRVRVKALPGFLGPPCTVRLVLPEDANPGLLTKKLQGAFKQALHEPGDEVELIADGVAFEGATPSSGRVYVGVDGYDRAFGYKNSFTKGTLQPLADGTRARIYGARFAPPDGKYPVRLEIDNPPSAAVLVDLGLDRAGNGQFNSTLLRGFRDSSVKVHLAALDGGLVFKTGLSDWSTILDTTDVVGARSFRLRLFTLDKGDKGKIVTLMDEQTIRDEALPIFDPKTAGQAAPLTFDATANTVQGALVIDVTPPEGLAFIDPPTKLIRGKSLELKAAAFDDLSDIQKILFFPGKPGPDGKFPPGIEPVVGKRAAKQTYWNAEVLVPEAVKDRLDVTVQAFNGAGLSSLETISIRIIDDKVASKNGATIKGLVKEGPRIQANVPVTLRDAKGEAKATVKTNDKGEYAFRNIAPGNYRVVAARGATMTRGETPVTVPEDKDEVAGVDVKLIR